MFVKLVLIDRVLNPISIAVHKRTLYIAHHNNISALNMADGTWTRLRNDTQQVMTMRVYDKDRCNNQIVILKKIANFCYRNFFTFYTPSMMLGWDFLIVLYWVGVWFQIELSPWQHHLYFRYKVNCFNTFKIYIYSTKLFLIGILNVCSKEVQDMYLIIPSLNYWSQTFIFVHFLNC